MRRFLITIVVSAAIFVAGALVTDRAGSNPFKSPNPQVDFVRLA
jgi:hypothetical protein